MRELTYPLNQAYKIYLPDEWLGDHLLTYQNARERIQTIAKGSLPEEKVPTEGLPQALTDLALALCLLDDFDLPGLPAGNPGVWRVDQCPLRVAIWVKTVVLDDFATSFTLPKN